VENDGACRDASTGDNGRQFDVPADTQTSMLKAELHSHTSADPHDYIPHSTTQLIDRAAELGYNALAITLHDTQFDIRHVREYARDRRITLISGVEKSIAGKHVLLLNFSAEAEAADTFEKLARLRQSQPQGLVIAPHPFYPARFCLGRLLETHAELFDAVEFNAFYTAALNQFNQNAVSWAHHVGKPVVANADVHRLRQLGRTFTLVDAPPDPDAICEAIRAGRVTIQTRPLSSIEAATYLAELMLASTRRPKHDRSTTAGSARS
jgi:predicted metal-dependent phosphoesterase TrpH